MVICGREFFLISPQPMPASDSHCDGVWRGTDNVVVGHHVYWWTLWIPPPPSEMSWPGQLHGHEAVPFQHPAVPAPIMNLDQRLSC